MFEVEYESFVLAAHPDPFDVLRTRPSLSVEPFAMDISGRIHTPLSLLSIESASDRVSMLDRAMLMLGREDFMLDMLDSAGLLWHVLLADFDRLGIDILADRTRFLL